jgi:hypothetical protein
MQTETLQKKNLAMVGEEISHELGAQMVKDFQVANPSEVKSYYIGKNIISQILAQPGCVGIKFYNAYNEEGQKTLVYVGVDEFGKNIVEYTVVNNDGSFDKQKAIVADRCKDDLWEWLASIFD